MKLHYRVIFRLDSLNLNKYIIPYKTVMPATLKKWKLIAFLIISYTYKNAIID